MSKISKSIIVMMLLILIFNQSTNVSAKENTDLLAPYELKLQELNNQLGTNYSLIPEETLIKNGGNIDSMTKFFTSLSMEQFEDYILSLNQSTNCLETNDSGKISDEKLSNEIITYSIITSTRQRYYYFGSNCLRIDADIHSIGSIYVYDNSINYGQSHTSYPYYDPSQGFSYSFSADKTKVYCNFKCVKYLSQYIIDNVYYNINVTFSAGGGDIYQTA